MGLVVSSLYYVQVPYVVNIYTRQFRSVFSFTSTGICKNKDYKAQYNFIDGASLSHSYVILLIILY